MDFFCEIRWRGQGIMDGWKKERNGIFSSFFLSPLAFDDYTRSFSSAVKSLWRNAIKLTLFLSSLRKGFLYAQCLINARLFTWWVLLNHDINFDERTTEHNLILHAIFSSLLDCCCSCYYYYYYYYNCFVFLLLYLHDSGTVLQSG